MRRYPTIVATACVALCVLPVSSASALPAADKRIWRVDSLIATAKGNEIQVQAKGAVQTGGWSKPRLHVLHADAHTITVEFLATPPPPGMTVIEALVPLAVSARLRGRAASVHVLADQNEITSQVLR